jgi:hypothetical protein
MLPRWCKLRSSPLHEAHQRDLWLHWGDIGKDGGQASQSDVRI